MSTRMNVFVVIGWADDRLDLVGVFRSLPDAEAAKIAAETAPGRDPWTYYYYEVEEADLR